MTAVDERPPIAVDQFEVIARSVAREAEGLRLEFIKGKLGVKAVPDGDHGTIISWLMRICMQSRPELWFYPEQGLQVETYRKGRARADGVLANETAFRGQGDWADPSPVLMVVEVTSYDADTDNRDRLEKPRAYAQAGIPVYLLIDRDTCEVVVHSEPDGERYETVHRRPFGKQIELPAPIQFVLDTEPLKDWVR